MESLHMVNETKAYFEKATQVDQNYTDAYYNLGRVLNAQGNLILLAGITRLQLKFLQIMLMYTGLGKLLAGGQKITKDGTLICEPDHKMQRNIM